MTKKVLMLMLSLSLSFSVAAEGGKKAKTVTKENKKNMNIGKASQKKVDRLSDQTQAMLMKYRQTLTQIKNAKIYNEQLKKIIKSQTIEKVSIGKQIEELKETNEGIVPLMVSMIENMEKFVSFDVPFLPEERSKRVTDLNNLLSRADISTSEKFRQVLEAYQIENEYGRTIEAYRGVKKNGEKELTVDYLRIGRVAFIYQSLDGKETAVWDQETKKWEGLGNDYNKSIQSAIKMARKQLAPQLVKLPLAAVKDRI
ncbi:MAG: DUF3450 domain-containing protein [Bacteriovoracaceae bacterium]|nr:DUF3450 domain-containing protein [Bacteriovoracaceae bacterium]